MQDAFLRFLLQIAKNSGKKIVKNANENPLSFFEKYGILSLRRYVLFHPVKTERMSMTWTESAAILYTAMRASACWRTSGA